MPKKSFDALLLFVLVIAKVQIDTLADNVLPTRIADVQALLQSWPALLRMDHPQTDPVTMLLYVAAFGLLLLYWLVGLAAEHRNGKWLSPRLTHGVKMGLLYGIIGVLVVGKTLLLMGLRHHNVPWSYSHDGGVIQTETTILYFLEGRSPYIEDYVNTPMAEWGINEYRTALYHFPYLPWIFVFSAPFYLLGQALWGWYDQRMLYLLFFALTLLLTHTLFKRRENRLPAVMLIGLNPIMAEDIIFGVTDPYVFFWVLAAVWLLTRWRSDGVLWPLWASAAMLGIAAATKPTAWFLFPFWLLYVLRDLWGTRLLPPWSAWGGLLGTVIKRAWPLPVVMLAIVGPWLAWDPAAMYDDVWRWSAGQGETGYQIWGWGASNLVLLAGWVPDRFAYYPFIIWQAILVIPLFIYLIWRQTRQNTIGAMLYGYGLFFFVFVYFSRFMQPNYLGFLAAVFVISYFYTQEERLTDESPTLPL